jgi:hypothetical protein
VLFFNAEFATITFFHWLEHMVHDRLPFALYTDEPFNVPVIDADGTERIVTTYVFADEAIRRRRLLQALELKEAIACTQDMLRTGRIFYELSDL